MEKNRVSVKLKNPNPLFEKWIMEWRDLEREKNSSKEYCYSNALKSLKKYPLALESGKDCMILKGFGLKLCQMLDRKLEDYKNGNQENKIVQVKKNLAANSLKKNNSNTKKQEPETRVDLTNEAYVPVYRSGAYAILLSLYLDTLKDDSKGTFLKDELIEEAQKYCNSSFLQSSKGNYYTAWSSMGALIKRKLIKKEDNPPKYSLTDVGLITGNKVLISHQSYNANMRENGDILQSNGEHTQKLVAVSSAIDLINTQPRPQVTTKPLKGNRKEFTKVSSNISEESAVEETFIFAQNSFDIYLLVDTQETSGKINQIYDMTLLELKNLNVLHEVRHLKIGDYTWICRERGGMKELLLPYIVERKRIDDFGSSIKDGRFHEQKFRLKQSGVQNLIYLVEMYDTEHTGLPLNTLYQAATNTLVQDEFSVKFTSNLKGTVEYLHGFTRILNKLYMDKTLVSCPKENLSRFSLNDDIISLMTFKEFNKSSMKNKQLKVRDFFIKQLLQLKGMSVEKAVAIAETYPTPRYLLQKYRMSSAKEGETLLCNVIFGKLQKKVGPVISKSMYQFYRENKF